MRTLTLAAMLLVACGDNGDMNITQTAPTSLTDGMSSAGSTSNDPSGASTSTTAAMTTGDTTGSPTTEPVTTGPTTESTVATTATTGDGTTGELTTGATTDVSSSSGGGDDMDLMKTYGHACANDDDCKTLLGPDGICQKDILGVYNLPDGYCTTYCQLPDQQTTYITDSPDCLMGADCVGLMGYFEACAHECTDNIQCPRDGYECRQMPQISNPGDPKFCLMTEDNMIPP